MGGLKQLENVRYTAIHMSWMSFDPHSLTYNLQVQVIKVKIYAILEE